MIRDGFELPGLGGRKVFLRGQPVPSETQTPRSPSGKSDLGYADEVIVRNGKGVVPIHPDDIPVDELNGMIHNADSDIPLEIIVRALRTALDEDDDLGHEAERRLANEAMIEVRDVIGPSIMEAVEVEYEKQLREGAAAGKQVDEDSLLARL